MRPGPSLEQLEQGRKIKGKSPISPLRSGEWGPKVLGIAKTPCCFRTSLASKYSGDNQTAKEPKKSERGPVPDTVPY